MKIKSWYDEYRKESKTEEELEKERENARQNEANWRNDNKRLFIQEDLLCDYANLKMKEELFRLGDELLIEFADSKENDWVLSAVYEFYGRYHLEVNEPEEALRCYRLAIERSTFPSPMYEYIAAACVESGEFDEADKWIGLSLDDHRSRGGGIRSYCSEFAQYFYDTNRFERAAALLLEGYGGTENMYIYDTLLLGRAYIGMGKTEEGVALINEFLTHRPDDEWAWTILASAYYNELNEVEKAEQAYLRSVEAAADRDDVRKWNMQVYNYASIIFANEGIWDKCFHYLRLYYDHKYDEGEANVFHQLIDQMPSIENHEMGIELYQAIKQFEDSALRPGGKQNLEGSASAAPADDANIEHRKGTDMFNLDELSNN